MVVVGVDGFRRGWVAVVVHDDRFAAALPFASVSEVLQTFAEARVVAIDVPIGLPTDGLRPADVAARAYLGPRSSSVFATPQRDALEARSYADARRVRPSTSAQAYALRSKILEVDAVAASDVRVYEVHPEISFRALAGRSLPSKRTWNGQTDRRRALERAGIDLPDDLGEAGRVPPDDVLDAAAAAWSAGRIADGRAATLPAGVRDRIGPIWF